MYVVARESISRRMNGDTHTNDPTSEQLSVINCTFTLTCTPDCRNGDAVYIESNYADRLVMLGQMLKGRIHSGCMGVHQIMHP